MSEETRRGLNDLVVQPFSYAKTTKLIKIRGDTNQNFIKKISLSFPEPFRHGLPAMV